jgi:hypothetical protein
MTDDTSKYDHDGMSSGETHGKPDNAAEVVLNCYAERGDGREVVGANSVQQSSSEHG